MSSDVASGAKSEGTWPLAPSSTRAGPQSGYGPGSRTVACTTALDAMHDCARGTTVITSSPEDRVTTIDAIDGHAGTSTVRSRRSRESATGNHG